MYFMIDKFISIISCLFVFCNSIYKIKIYNFKFGHDRYRNHSKHVYRSLN